MKIFAATSRFWRRLARLLLLLSSAAGITAAAHQESVRPNIIFILTDDLGWGDIASFGNPAIPTPNIDRLAREGTRFEQFYTASPVCSSSRAGFLTGKCPTRIGVPHVFFDPARNRARGMGNYLDPTLPSVARQLQAAGYATAHFGKWHLGHSLDAPSPAAYGFDVHATYESNGPVLGAAHIVEYEETHPAWRYPSLNEQLNVDYIPHYRAYTTEWMVAESIHFIDTHRDRPFYLDFWTLVPHTPLNPTPEQLEKVKDLKLDPNDPAFGSWMRSYYANIPDLQPRFQRYAASIVDLDEQIGRLLDYLDTKGLAQNTLILFSSDNGPEDWHVRTVLAGTGSTRDLRARKRSLYEGGIRTPFILRWPGHVPAGQTDSSTILSALDYLPTILHLAGAPLPADYRGDGADMSPAWLGRSTVRPTPLLWEWLYPVAGPDDTGYRPPGLAIRDGDWKLHLSLQGKPEELYNIPLDRQETKNVITDHREVAARLAKAATAWQATQPIHPATSP